VGAGDSASLLGEVDFALVEQSVRTNASDFDVQCRAEQSVQLR